jgi:hypothetical protein
VEVGVNTALLILKEFLDAIKGGPASGSDFNYSTRLTEMAAIGVLTQRFNTRFEFDAKNMKVTNHEGMENYIKEPVREGWSFGEET